MKSLFLIGTVLLTTLGVFADDTTTTETCANGAGKVITGVVSGRKYCLSNSIMTWFNAVSWCDGLNMELFDRSDCACGDIVADCANNICPEVVNTTDRRFWTKTPSGTTKALAVYMPRGSLSDYDASRAGKHHFALCK